jgi:cobalt-zinc-cadmium efflux system outer membrane protein
VISSRLFLIVVFPLLMLSACATLPDNQGREDVHNLISARTARPLPAPGTDTAALIQTLLTERLSASDAVYIALLNNPRLRAQYARLGFSAAEVYNAGRLSNPTFGVSVMYSDEHSTANQVTFGLAQSFTDLLLLPARGRLAEAEFEKTKLEVSAAAFELAADTEEAYLQLIGAQQVAAMRGNVDHAAAVSAQLAQRFYDAGNISALQLTLELSTASGVKLAALRASAEVVVARNALNRLMGLRAGDKRWTVADQLYLPVAAEDELNTLIDLAWRSRLDLAARQLQVASLADSLGVSRRFRYLGESEIGIETERETDRSRLTGPYFSIELPVFNTGAGRVAQAQALVDEAEAELQLLALDIGNDVQLAHAQVQASRTIFDHYRNALVPLRETVVDLTQQQVSYMLEGQFQLLQVKQEEFDAYQGYLEALRDYWIARTYLSRAIGTRLPSSDSIEAQAVGPIILPGSPAADIHAMHSSPAGERAMDHSIHAKINRGPQQ